MNILISNDDGINAEGIKILAQEISKIANTYVVAPDSPRSASGHAITLHKPILINDEFIAENVEAYSTSGTPADCVKVGIESILKDIEIDLVLSGINNGSNLGTDVIYSGTVSAALEGFILNKPSIAISYDEVNVKREIYKDASKYVVNLIENIKDKLDLLNDCILNVNIPNTKIKGSKITKLGQRNYDNAMVEKINPFGQKYYWIGGKLMELDQDEDSDIACVKDGYISITPINIEMTNLRKFELLKDIKMI